MQSWKVVLESVTPYMQHAMRDIPLEKWEAGHRPHIIERPDANDDDEKRAEYHSYFDVAQNSYYIPDEHIRGALIMGGSFVKSKVGNARKSMTNIVAAMFEIKPEHLLIPPYDIIDKRSAVNKNIKGRVMVVRPMWSQWKVSFTLEIGEDSVTKPMITEIFRSAGAYVGMGSYRPTAKGKYGRFQVVELIKIS